jgi:dihydrofolate reductase
MSRKLGMFNNVSLDGYFTDANSDMSFAKPQGHDDEHLDFMRRNAKGDSMLVFGRVTYEMMAGFWPTEMAQKMMPEMAKTMNTSPKIVFSRTLKKADWTGTTLLPGDPATEIARLKQEDGPGMTVLGSGQIAAQLAQAGLFDEIGLMVIPVVLGKGRTLFDGVTGRPRLKLKTARPFQSGNVYLTYD